MKKILVTILCFIMVFLLVGCGSKTSEIRTYNVESEMYSQEEITSAIETIKEEFKSDWKGCTLKEIYYAGDESSKDYQDWADRNNADEVIVLLSSFYVGRNGGNGSLNTNYTYENWNWILVRTNDGEWVHVDHGY